MECRKIHGWAPGPSASQLFVGKDTTPSSVAIHNAVIGLAPSKSVINVM